MKALNTISFVVKRRSNDNPRLATAGLVWGFGQEVYGDNEYSHFIKRYSTKIGGIDLEKVGWAGYCENDYLGLLFPMKAWLFFSVALLVYGFAFESTFAKDKSPTIATLGAAFVAGSLMWVVWRINGLLCLISFFILWYGLDV